MKIGFIGTGNMGSAILKGHLKSTGKPDQILAYDADEGKLEALQKEYGIQIRTGIEAVAEEVNIILFAVKPNMYDSVVPKVVAKLQKDALVISIAAGISIAKVESYFSGPVKVVRVMPNTPAMVGEGMSALCRNSHVTDEEFAMALKIFEGLGQAEAVNESLIDAVIGVSGSSPAYVYMFIEALADGAVAEGMPRKQAYKFAAQAVLGSAKMVLETGSHPGELKDAVCSPGGTTIQSVRVLEELGFRSAVIEAVAAAAEKSREMSGK